MFENYHLDGLFDEMFAERPSPGRITPPSRRG
jgi:hypothetical protein